MADLEVLHIKVDYYAAEEIPEIIDEVQKAAHKDHAFVEEID